MTRIIFSCQLWHCQVLMRLLAIDLSLGQSQRILWTLTHDLLSFPRIFKTHHSIELLLSQVILCDSGCILVRYLTCGILTHLLFCLLPYLGTCHSWFLHLRIVHLRCLYQWRMHFRLFTVILVFTSFEKDSWQVKLFVLSVPCLGEDINQFWLVDLRFVQDRHLSP